MLLGPLLGGMIDRHGRLRCAIAAELIGALAFAGLVFAHGAVPLLSLALAAGLGSALLRPATCALLPAVVSPASLGAANGLFGAVREIGQLIGPALAAGVLLVAEPEVVLALNAVTFAASTLLLTRLRGHVAPVAVADGEDEVRSHLLGVLEDRFIRSLVLTSGAVILSRTFHRDSAMDFEREVAALRQAESTLAGRTPPQVQADAERIAARIRSIAAAQTPRP